MYNNVLSCPPIDLPLIKSNLFKRNQEGLYNKMSKQKREAIASLFCLIQEHSIHLAYNPFTARYERDNLCRYITADKCSHCDTWDGGNSRQFQRIFEYCRP